MMYQGGFGWGGLTGTHEANTARNYLAVFAQGWISTYANSVSISGLQLVSSS
jgi:hypothetical protein